MTVSLTQRLALSTLVTDCELLIRAGVLPDSAESMLSDSIAAVNKAFDELEIRVGDHDPEPANYAAVQDAVQSAMSEEQ